MGKKDGSSKAKSKAAASSGRTAAMMQQQGGFVGFETLAGGNGGLGYLGAAGGGADEDTNLSAELRQLLVKLKKKDSITKLKCLQDLYSYLSDVSEDDFAGALKHWPRLFSRLALDNDRRVRLHAHNVMHRLAANAKKALVPYLKSLIGPWLCGQFDPNREVAAAARAGLHAVFPDEKKVKTVVFCKTELLNYIREHLTEHTAQTLSDAHTDLADQTAKYERVVMSNLLALAYIVDKVPQSELCKVEAELAAITGGAKFWKLAKYQSGLVRGGVFDFVSAAAKSHPVALTADLKKTTTIVFSGLKDSDSSVLRAALNATLHLLLHVPDCWQAVNVRKVIFPEVFSLLSNGGRNCPDLTAKIIVPLLSRIPPEVIGDGLEFYQNWLSNIESGILNFPQTAHKLIAGYFECIKYLIKEPHTPVAEFSLTHSSLFLSTLAATASASLFLTASSLFRACVSALASARPVPDTVAVAMVTASLAVLERQQSSSEKEAAEQALSVVSSDSAQGGLSVQPSSDDKLNESQFDTSLLSELDTSVAEQVSGQALNKIKEALNFLHLFWLNVNSNEMASTENKEDNTNLIGNDNENENGNNNHYTTFMTTVTVRLCKWVLEIIENPVNLNTAETSTAKTSTAETETESADANNSNIDASQDSLSLDTGAPSVTPKIENSLTPVLTPSAGLVFLSSLLGLAKDSPSLFGSRPDTLSISAVSFIEELLLPLVSSARNQAVVLDVVGAVLQWMEQQGSAAVGDDANSNSILLAKIYNACDDLTAKAHFLKKCGRLTPTLLSQWMDHCTQNGHNPVAEELATHTQSLKEKDSLTAEEIEFISACMDQRLVKFISADIRQDVAHVAPGYLQTVADDLALGNKTSNAATDTALNLLDAAAQLFMVCVSENNQSALEAFAAALFALAHPLRRKASKSTQMTRRQLKQQAQEALSSVVHLLLNAEQIEQPLRAMSANTLVHTMTEYAVEHVKAVCVYGASASEIVRAVGEVNDILSCIDRFQPLTDIEENILPLEADLKDMLPVIATQSEHLFSGALSCLAAYDANTENNNKDPMSWICRVALIAEVCTENSAIALRFLKQKPWLLAELFVANQLRKVSEECKDASGELITEEQTAYLDIAVECLSKLLNDSQPSATAATQDEQQDSLDLADSSTSTNNTNSKNAEKKNKDSVVNSEGHIILAPLSASPAIVHAAASYLYHQLVSSNLEIFRVAFEQAAHWLALHNQDVLALVDWDSPMKEKEEGMKGMLAALQTVSIAAEQKGMGVDKLKAILDKLTSHLKTFTSPLPAHGCDPVALLAVVSSLLANAQAGAQTDASELSSSECQPVAAPKTIAGAKALERMEKAAKLAGAASTHTRKIIQGVMDLLCEWRAADENCFVVEGEGEGDEYLRSVALCIEASRVFRFCIEASPGHLSTDHWDIILCNMLAWLESEDSSVLGRALLSQACLIMEVCALCFDNTLKVASQGGVLPGALAQVSAEWRQFFLPGACEQTLARFTAVCESGDCSAFADALALAARHVTVAVLDSDHFLPLVKGLAARSVAVQSSAYVLLMRLLEGNAKDAIGNTAEFINILNVQADQDNLSDRSSLLTWSVFCAFYRLMGTEDRASIAEHISSEGLVGQAMEMLFHYIPDETRGISFDDSYKKVFPIWDQFSLNDDSLCLLAGHTYYQACLTLPALTRNWWSGDCSRQVAQKVEQFTNKGISELVANEELSIAQGYANEDENFQIKVRKNAREVAAVYTVDTMTMELVVALLPGHPLKNVEVRCNQRVGVPSSLWRKWLLQMTTYIAKQNGSLLDGILLWKKNIEKHFEGIDDCTICYAVIHDTNFQLPDKKCRTCKNGFHAACLYKWFRNSGQSSCPLCRNLF